jgi:hypothetical protein
MKINSAKNPQWGNTGHTVICLEVDFDDIPDAFIPFTASATYDMLYGRELFARAVNGEFGVVGEYVAPVITDEQFNAEVLSQINTIERKEQLPRAIRESLLETSNASTRGWYSKVKGIDDSVVALRATLRAV